MRAPLLAYRIPKRARTLPRPLQPDAQRLFYFSALRSLISKAHALVSSELLPLIAAHFDADLPPDLSAKIDEVAEKFGRQLSRAGLRALAQEVAIRTSDFQKAQLVRQLQDAMGVTPLFPDTKLAEQMAAFVKENVDLIKSIPEQYFADVRKVVTEAAQAGTRAATVAAQLEERYGVAESRAKLVANTETGKFYGQLNDQRQRDLGIDRAVWRTARDNRVRDSHQHLEGETYALGEGLYDEQLGEMVLPGEAPNCRCFGEPFLDGLL